MPDQKAVYTFADLKNWSTATSDLAHPARLSVFGDPVAHSLSPEMHNPGLRAADLDCEYVRLHIKPEELADAFPLLIEQGFIGTNVTIPHKMETLAAMDELTEVARRIGAVNTVLISDGKLIGHNSDGPGFERAIREEFSVDLKDMRVLILGAGGGAGKAAAVQCALERCERLVLANRSVEKAEKLAGELEEFFHDETRLEGPAKRLDSISLDPSDLQRELENIDLIVNATPIGMKRSDPEVIPGNLIQPHHLVYDMIYSPPRTRLLTEARAAGARWANGLSMLLWQGAISFEFWFGQDAPVSAMKNGLKSAVES